jgi:hypothetical protein
MDPEQARIDWRQVEKMVLRTSSGNARRTALGLSTSGHQILAAAPGKANQMGTWPCRTTMTVRRTRLVSQSCGTVGCDAYCV